MKFVLLLVNFFLIINSSNIMGQDLDVRNYLGETKLMRASKNGEFKIVKELLNQGANPNSKSNTQWTALMLASNNGHSDIVKILLENSANINAKNDIGMTALMIASSKADKKIIKILLKNGADINLQDNNGWNALHYANNNSTINQLLKFKKEYPKNYEELGMEVDLMSIKVFGIKARLLHKQSKYDEAIFYLNKILLINSIEYTEIYGLRAVELFQLGKIDLALEDVNLEIKLDPNNSNSYFMRGMIYCIKNKSSLAISDFNKAINIEPNNADYYKERGTLYYELGNTEKACQDWKEACELGSCQKYNTAIKNGICK